MKVYLRLLILVALLALTVAGCTSPNALLAEGVAGQLAGQVATGSETNETTDVEVLRFDMAEDFTRFVFDPDIVHEDGYPVHGSTFITQGYLYPAGTLDGSDGVNADGSPEFPDKVIGIWICRGWVLGETMGSDGLPSAISTQFFQLGKKHGNRTIVTEGYEFMQPDGPFLRAITGGTGEYRNARGEQIQEVLGINEYMGMAMRFELRVER